MMNGSNPVKKPSTDIQGDLQTQEREAVEVSVPITMHTGQIIMLTKMLTSSDLRFYEFEGDVPLVFLTRAVRLKRSEVINKSSTPSGD